MKGNYHIKLGNLIAEDNEPINILNLSHISISHKLAYKTGINEKTGFAFLRKHENIISPYRAAQNPSLMFSAMIEIYRITNENTNFEICKTEF